MALTLDISPNMETLLRLQAGKSNLSMTEYLLRLVESDLNVNLSEHADLEDFASSVAAIQEGLADIESGRTISFEDWCAREDLRISERQTKTAPASRKVEQAA